MTTVKSTLTPTIVETDEGLREWHQERVIFDATELICEHLSDRGMTRSQLAQGIGKTKGYVTQLLDGTTNMTLRTLSDALLAVGATLHLAALPVHQEPDAGEPMVATDDATVTFATQFTLNVNADWPAPMSTV